MLHIFYTPDNKHYLYQNYYTVVMKILLNSTLQPTLLEKVLVNFTKNNYKLPSTELLN